LGQAQKTPRLQNPHQPLLRALDPVLRQRGQLHIVQAKDQLDTFAFLCGKTPFVGHCGVLDQRFDRRLSSRKVPGVRYPLIGI
jgi:hypothetical protein